MNEYPRESVEFQPVAVTVDGATQTAGVQFCDAPEGVRPTAWTAPTVIEGKIGVMVGGYPPGLRTVWARVTSTPEDVVIDCGPYRVT